MLNIINRDEYRSFKPSEPPTYKVGKRIKSVKAVRYSPDEEYEQLKAKGQQIDISNPEYMVNNRKTIDGLFSPLFGPDASHDAQAFTCACRETTGAAKHGQICPKCHTEVKEIEIDLSRRGHIDIAPFHILTNHGYIALKKIIKNLDDLFKTTKKIDLKGKLVPDDNYTIMDLYDRYDEDFYPLTGLEKKYAFMSKIPVISAKLRPLIRNGVVVTMLEENKRYLSIITLANSLKTISALGIDAPVQIQKSLNQIQRDFLEILRIERANIAGKTGVFRQFLATGRIDNSSRMVIVLGRDLRPYEIDIPYQTAMVIYEENIVNRVSRIENIPVAKAIQKYLAALNTRDERFVKIINGFLKEKNGVWALINRNPTINESGILYMRVRKINDREDDYSMHLPPDVLTPLGADFDGDQLTYGAVKNPKFHKHFLTFCPSYAIIDRSTGYFNRGMGFEKDYAAILSILWDIGRIIENFNSNPCAETYDALVRSGLPTPYDAPTDASNLGWDGEGLDPIFKVPFEAINK